MEKFRQKIQLKIILISLTVLSIAVAYLVLLSGKIINPPSVPDFIKGFNMGAFAGVQLTLAFFIVKYVVSLRKEASLKKLYIEQNDERRKLILQKTGDVGMTLGSIGFAVATIISGFFSETVFLTLLCATVFISLIRGACKLYYYKKL